MPSEFGLDVLVRPRPAPFVYRYEIQEPWYDGDSPRVILDLGMHRFEREISCRLYGIDTPEMRGTDKERGRTVRDIVRQRCPPGSTGVLESHKQGTGKYGRLLVTMWPDGWDKSVNEWLFDNGLAVIKTYNKKTDDKLRELWLD